MKRGFQMNIGVIGAGAMGKPIAAQFAAAGHDVILANSRGPESLQDFAKSTGLTAGTRFDAAKADIIVLAVRWENRAAALSDLDLTGKILIDVTNQMEKGDLPENRGSLLLQSHFPDTKIVKAFNTLYAQYLDGNTTGARRFLAFAGDDDDAKSTVKAIFSAMGYYPYDVGSLALGNATMEFGAVLSAQHFTVPNDKTLTQVLVKANDGSWELQVKESE